MACRNYHPEILKSLENLFELKYQKWPWTTKERKPLHIFCSLEGDW